MAYSLWEEKRNEQGQKRRSKHALSKKESEKEAPTPEPELLARPAGQWR